MDPKKQNMWESCGLKRPGYGLALEEQKTAAATVATLTVAEMLAELRRLRLPTSATWCPGGRQAALLTFVHGLGAEQLAEILERTTAARRRLSCVHT